MKLTKTITFYLTTEYARELNRLAEFKRLSPHEYCKQRIMTHLDKARPHQTHQNEQGVG